jgi:hypothetical protein
MRNLQSEKLKIQKEILWGMRNLMDRGEYYKIQIRSRWSGSILLDTNLQSFCFFSLGLCLFVMVSNLRYQMRSRRRCWGIWREEKLNTWGCKDISDRPHSLYSTWFTLCTILFYDWFHTIISKLGFLLVWCSRCWSNLKEAFCGWYLTGPPKKLHGVDEYNA